MRQRRSDLHYLRLLLSYLIRERQLFLVTTLFAGLGFVVTFIFPWLVGRLIDHILASPETASQGELLFITGAAAVTSVLFAVSGYGRGHYNFKLGNRIAHAIREDLYQHLQRIHFGHYAQFQPGAVTWRLMSEVHGVNGLIHSGIILTLMDVAQLAIAYILLLSISLPLTIAVSCIIPLYVVVFWMFGKRVRVIGEVVSWHTRSLSGKLNEKLSSQDTIRMHCAEGREAHDVTSADERQFSLIEEQSHVGHLMGAVSGFFIHLGTTIILGYGGYLSLHGAPLSPGQLTQFIGYVGILYGPIRRFADLNVTVQNSLIALREVFSTFDLPLQTAHNLPRLSPPRSGVIRFERVSFGYKKGELQENILKEVEIEIEDGEHVALIGASGSGKTTLLSLLPRLYDVTSGRLYIDGDDVRDYSLEALRSQIAWVPQFPFIFSASIAQNIAYGRPEAHFSEIVDAARGAYADEFIRSLPRGYETIVGERGYGLSGGQRQRIAIARAILNDPKILILDEATSALDIESERHVRSALARLMEGRTCLIATHKLDTLHSVHRIISLERGRVVEMGHPRELLRGEGFYARMVNLQRRPAHEEPHFNRHEETSFP